MKASEAFRQAQMGTNMMTPNFDGYLEGNGYYVELSSGRGIENEPIYGVTVLVDVDGEVKRDWEAGQKLSRMFMSRREANDYAKALTS